MKTSVQAFLIVLLLFAQPVASHAQNVFLGDVRPGDVLKIYIGTEELSARIGKVGEIPIATRVSDPDLTWQTETRNGMEYMVNPLHSGYPKVVLEIYRASDPPIRREVLYWPYPLRRDLPR